jgi:hypothetical protein
VASEGVFKGASEGVSEGACIGVGSLFLAIWALISSRGFDFS